MLIGVLIIVIGAFIVATIEYVESVPLAIILQVIFLAAMVGVFIRDSQISFSVIHGRSAFGGADHGWQDIGLEGGARTLSQTVFWFSWATRRGGRCARFMYRD